MPLNTAQNEQLFDALAAAIDVAGSDQEAALLTRLALLLANEVGDFDRVLAALLAAQTRPSD